MNDDINHRRIVQAISDELAAKGLQRVAGSEGPDVLVAYYASFANASRCMPCPPVGVGTASRPG